MGGMGGSGGEKLTLTVSARSQDKAKKPRKAKREAQTDHKCLSPFGQGVWHIREPQFSTTLFQSTECVLTK